MSTFTYRQIRFATALLISGILVSGCSSSSDSQLPTADDLPSSEGAGGSDSSNSGATTLPGGATTSPTGQEPVISDPVEQNQVRVDFDITVPAYMSDALQVRLVWGEKEIVASWIGDETWAAYDIFPANAELPLVVTFYDDNGDITLGRFTTNFKTGTNGSETFSITADQFDTDQWDEDSDGVNNIDELIAGTNPVINESAPSEVRSPFTEDSRPEALRILGGVSYLYEWIIPAERPYSVQTTEEVAYSTDPVVYGITHNVVIDIDTSGNGSVSDTYERIEPSNMHTENKVATRTRTGNSVTWAGTDYWFDSSAFRGENIEFSIVTSMLDTQTHQQEGVIDRDTRGGFAPNIDISYALTGEVISGSPLCEPDAGTVTYSGIQDSSTGLVDTETTISKEAVDEYWAVKVTDSTGQILDEYLIQSTGTTFYCVFGG